VHDPPPPLELAVLDMAGTTVSENGSVAENVVLALRCVGVTPDEAGLRAVRGARKLEMFEALTPDAASAGRAYRQFVHGMLDDIASGRLVAKDGATATFEELHALGAKVCLITGFPPELRDPIVESLGWSELVDLVLSPEDAGRGRPFPDLIWAAMSRLEATGVHSVVVAGDTQRDLLAGHRSGAALVVGVLGGAHTAADLRQAPHTHLIDGIGRLPEVLPPQRISS
jgi:phosphoglycolate phosphatase